MFTAFNYMMLHNDGIADEFEALFGLRSVMAGLVQGSAPVNDDAMLFQGGGTMNMQDGSTMENQ